MFSVVIKLVRIAERQSKKEEQANVSEESALFNVNSASWNVFSLGFLRLFLQVHEV